MKCEQTNEAETLALRALVWALSDDIRAERFLALTGLDPESLRRDLSSPTLLAAALRYLEGHEPDLIACAEAIGVRPERLVESRHKLEARA